MTDEILVSKTASMKGYKFNIWWSKNKETIKILLASGVAVGLFFLPQIRDATASAAIGAAGGAVSKLLFDTLDFYFSEVKIENK